MTRRVSLLAIAGVLLAAAPLPITAAHAADPATGPSDPFPVTVEHKFGETTVDAAPERVVTVGLVEQDVLLALGVAPVATTEWFGEQPGGIFPWAMDELEALGAPIPESLGGAEAINFEAVAAQDPDLILAVYSGLTEQDYTRLAAIAPTVAQVPGYPDWGAPWDVATRVIGAAIGVPDQADELVESVEARFAAVREAHPEFDGASALMATPYEGIWVYGPDDPRSRFLTALGFELPDNLADLVGDEFGANISAEQAAVLDVDVIVWLDEQDAEGTLGGPLYASLPVHTEGREVFVDSNDLDLGSATSFVTPLSLDFLLDGIVPKIAAAIDGDPDTVVP